MRRFVFYFIFWAIGCFFSENSVLAADFQEQKQEADVVYKVQNSADTSVFIPEEIPEQGEIRKESIIKVDNPLIRFAVTPLLVDKVYQGMEIRGDIMPLLRMIYPNVSEWILERASGLIRSFVEFKRRYKLAVEILEQQVRAEQILPKDVPVVAEDGEYAPLLSSRKKESAEGEYGVSYSPYKYLEYDVGETGEPVRRRNKNYFGAFEQFNEFLLAMLTFDLPGMVKALRKVSPHSYPGGEIYVDGTEGVHARILLEVEQPGDDEMIRGVVDVHVPENYYINADYLVQQVKPRFILKEDGKKDFNISSYELFSPEANGVNKNGQNKRILIGNVAFPLLLKRSDIGKPVVIEGEFSFEVCHKDGECRRETTAHQLNLPAGKREVSVYANYVMKAFSHLPEEKSRHAALKETIWDAQNKTLTLKFAIQGKMSNVAVMVEDAAGTNFINPQFTITDDDITAVFDVAEAKSGFGNGSYSGEDVAITAAFNNSEVLRVVTAVNPVSEAVVSVEGDGFRRLASLFVLGWLFMLLPGVFTLFLSLARVLAERADCRMIVLRFGVTVLGLFGLWAVCCQMYFWSELCNQVWLTAAGGMIAGSYIAVYLGHIDFILFRPFKRFIRYGIVSGILMTVVLVSLPNRVEAMVFAPLFGGAFSDILKQVLALWLGFMTWPLFVLWRPRVFYAGAGLRRIGFFYMLFYLGALLLVLFFRRGLGAVLLLFVFAVGMFVLWRIYAVAINEAIKGVRAKAKQIDLFNTVQRHALLLLMLIYVLLSVALAFIPLNKPSEPPVQVENVLAEAETLSADDKPILVLVEADWSISSIINRIRALSLSKRGIDVHLIREQNGGIPWLVFYGKSYPPLHILFNQRHRRGLVLPERLENVDWLRATATFSELKNGTTLNNTHNIHLINERTLDD